MKWYYFTMTRSHIEHHWPGRDLPGGYVSIQASSRELAREQMFRIFGQVWSFDYENLDDIHETDRILLQKVYFNKIPS